MVSQDSHCIKVPKSLQVTEHVICSVSCSFSNLFLSHIYIQVEESKTLWSQMQTVLNNTTDAMNINR